MKFLKFTTVILLVLSFSHISNLIANENNSDSLYFSNSNMHSNFGNILGMDEPTIELIYGFGNPVIKSFDSDFEKVNLAEVRFGFNNYDILGNNKNLIDFSFNYFFIGNYSSNWNSKAKENSSEFNTDSWRFGFAWSDGQGYKIGKETKIILYQTDAWTWTKTRFIDSSLILVENNKMNKFADEFHFGDYFEGGIKFEIYKPFAINLSYQRGIVMPRHLFWYWLFSGTVERSGDFIVDWFTKKINKASPTFGPIAYFILHNAYSYAFYELRKSKMNWPFNTTEPLMYDGFNLGLTFTF